MTNSKSKILVVDDEPYNLQLFGQILQNQYQLSFATDGKKALDVAWKVKPDIILLDIMMPEMDGFEVCRRLKAERETGNIPIIFVTTKDEVEDEFRGFSLGCVDYITKPVSPPIVHARVKTHLKLKLALEQLEKQNEILQENLQLREDIDRITRHDLKGPLTGILGNPQLIRMEGNLSEGQLACLKDIEKSGRQILKMINLSLDLFKMEKGTYQLQPVAVDILKIINSILGERNNMVRARELTVTLWVNGKRAKEDDVFLIEGETLLCYAMLSNLITNALEASPEKADVTITLEENKRSIIRIHNLGAVPENIRDRFFEKYVTSGKERGTGLGTYSARLMAETQRGSIQLDTSEENGTTVTISFSKHQVTKASSTMPRSSKGASGSSKKRAWRAHGT